MKLLRVSLDGNSEDVELPYGNMEVAKVKAAEIALHGLCIVDDKTGTFVHYPPSRIVLIEYVNG